MQCAVELTVSQVALEDEYYMVDLPLLVDEKQRMDTRKMLSDITARAVPNMEEQPRREYIDRLRRQAGYSDDKAESGPDLEGLAKLKALLS